MATTNVISALINIDQQVRGTKAAWATGGGGQTDRQ